MAMGDLLRKIFVLRGGKAGGSFVGARRGGFTLLEIMTVVAIVGLLVAVAVPSFMRARSRSVASMVLSDARMLDGALDQYALENSKSQTSPVVFNDLTPYLKAGNKLAMNAGKDSLGNDFGIGPRILDGIRVSTTTKNDLSSAVGGDAFWGPYS